MTDERYEPTAEDRARMEELRKKLEKTFEEAVDWGIKTYDYDRSPDELKFLEEWRRDLKKKEKMWARFEKQISRNSTSLVVMGAIGSLRAAKRDHENGEEGEVHERRKDRARLLELAKAAELLADYFGGHDTLTSTHRFEPDEFAHKEFEAYFGKWEPYWEFFVEYHKLQAAAFRKAAPAEEPPSKIVLWEAKREQFRFMYRMSHWMKDRLGTWHGPLVLEIVHLVYRPQKFTKDQVKDHR
jgi:hypothetical protein